MVDFVNGINPRTGFFDQYIDPASLATGGGVPSARDASGGTLPSTTPGTPAWYIISVAGTLPGIWDVTVGDYIVWDGAARSLIDMPEWWALTEDVLSQFDVGAIDQWDLIAQWTTFTDFVKALLTDVFTPTYTNPTFSLSDNQANWQEIGTQVNLVLTYNFNRWSINGLLVWGVWQPGTFQDYRAWEANNYTIEGNDLGLVNQLTIPNYTLLATQTFDGQVSHDQGPQPLDSAGNPYQTPYPADTEIRQTTITALYPWFYGKVSGGPRPTRDQALINSGTKSVQGSSGTITANFNSSPSDWIWFAIPQTSTSKTKWYIDALNNGNIGGVTDLFDAEQVVSVDSPDVYWNGIPYKIYVSTFQTQVSNPMELRNS